MISNGLKYLKAIFLKFFSLHTDSIIFPSNFFFFFFQKNEYLRVTHGW